MNFELTSIGPDFTQIEITLLEDKNYAPTFIHKKYMIDKIIISAYGRNIHAQVFSSAVTYRVFDFLMPREYRHAYPCITIFPTEPPYPGPKVFIKSDGKKLITLKNCIARPIPHFIACLQALDKEYSSHLRIRYAPELIEPKGLKELQAALLL